MRVENAIRDKAKQVPANRSKFRRIEDYLRAREAAAERIGLGVALALAITSFGFAAHAIGTSTGQVEATSLLPSLSGGVPLNQALAAARIEPEVTGSVSDSSEMMRTVFERRSAALGGTGISQDYVVRKVQRGAAIVEGPTGTHQVVPGAIVAGIGRIISIEQTDAGWIVVTSETVIAEKAL